MINLCGFHSLTVGVFLYTSGVPGLFPLPFLKELCT